MLPAAAVFYFPWEINGGALQDGASIRTFGRLMHYQPEESKATLTAQHASTENKVIVHTLLVEPFDVIIGAHYIVLGEIENVDDGGVVIRARILNCVDGLNLALFQKAINEQRSFFQEREIKAMDCRPPSDPT